MAEAVAERLLDLHCRLISLYILNEADSLSWHSNKPFFERERCSYVIQMWWLYMQGEANPRNEISSQNITYPTVRVTHLRKCYTNISRHQGGSVEHSLA